MSSMGGATNTRTWLSTSRYLAVPRTTCFPGAPVRCPPGRYAWRVPVCGGELHGLPSTLVPAEEKMASGWAGAGGQRTRRGQQRRETHPCSSPCCRAWA